MKGNSMFDFAEHHASTIKMRTVKKIIKKMLNKCAGRENNENQNHNRDEENKRECWWL